MAEPEDTIRRRIRERGRMTFAEFMECALYGPGGYYTAGQPIGAGGDYYTSPSAHPVFGALIALQLEQMWRLLGEPTRFHVVEPGAGDGTLANDILSYASHLDPGFGEALTYAAVDASPRPREQAPPQVGADGGSQGTPQWVRSDGFPFGDVTGCVLSNELVDSLPVHWVRTHNGRLEELYVALQGDRLARVWEPPSTSDLERRIVADGAALEEGWEGEVTLRAAAWMATISDSLRQGYVLTIDYGDTAERLFTAERARGTVMSYYRHTPQGDPLARVGRQDITAHANFTTLINAGMERGLRPITLMTQAEFLRNLGIESFAASIAATPSGNRQAELAGLRDLVRTDGLGGFRVLVQGKGVPAAELACLGNAGYRKGLEERLKDLPAPRLQGRHMNLLEGRYPDHGQAWFGGR